MASEVPVNAAAFSSAQVVEATGGAVLSRGDGRAVGVVTDSRRVVPGCVFVALRGERFDGHRFAASAVDASAAMLIVEDSQAVDERVTSVRVDCTLTALGALAALHRRRTQAQVIAVAGSAGKTSTRSAISAVLDTLMPGEVWFAPGNLNNRIGVPMVLLATQQNHRVAVIEIGTNQPGEVGLLAEICQPDIGVLTLIDLEHTEGLGGIEAIAEEEAAIWSTLSESQLAIGNADDVRVASRLAAVHAQKTAYGRAVGADYRILERHARRSGGADVTIRRSAGDLRVACPLTGEPGALSLAAALAVAEAVYGDVTQDQLQAAMAHPGLGEQGRLQPVELDDGMLVIDDTYNSNPASVRASVAAALEIAEMRSGRVVAVLGEMLELGEFSQAEHQRVGRFLSESRVGHVVAVQGDACHITAELPDGRGTFVSTAQDAATYLLGELRASDIVLVKGSRGVGLETVVHTLLDTRGCAA